MSPDDIGLVRSMGLEPIRLLTHAPQTCLSAYSSTTADILFRASFAATIDILHESHTFVNV